MDVIVSNVSVMATFSVLFSVPCVLFPDVRGERDF